MIAAGVLIGCAVVLMLLLVLLIGAVLSLARELKAQALTVLEMSLWTKYAVVSLYRQGGRLDPFQPPASAAMPPLDPKAPKH